MISGTGAYEGARGTFLAKSANAGNQYTITVLPWVPCARVDSN